MTDHSPPFSSQRRTVAWAELSTRKFDLLIVGGGITGAGLAHAAAGHGLRVALVEQGDFASGTSSRTSRLIHGGLRYLMHGQVTLVRDSLREQGRLACAAPHLIRPLAVLLPLYGKSRVRRLAYRGGMEVYKHLQPDTTRENHETLSAEAMCKREPLLYGSAGDEPAELQGGFAFREYLAHDARLVWEIVLDAQRRGASVINYARLVNLITARGGVAGGIVEDAITGQIIEVRAQIVVNTTGPWSNRFIAQCSPLSRQHHLRLTKGAHIVVARRHLPLSHAIIFFAPRDRRGLIAVPTENMVVIGTTETDFDGDDPGTVRAEANDIKYLLEATQNFFGSAANLTSDSVVAKWAGVRPLYSRDKRPVGAVSRAYAIEWHAENLLSVLGGKLTLHARAANRALRVILPKLGHAAPPAIIKAEALPGAVWECSQEETINALSRAGLETDAIAHLVSRYGSRSSSFAGLLRENPAWRKRIVPELPDIFAEVVFAVRAEMAVCLADFTERRTDLGLRAKAENVELPLEVESLFKREASQYAVCLS